MSQGFVSEKDKTRRPVPPEKLEEIFGDFEARANLVGLYELLLKIDQRNNPHLYRSSPAQPDDPDHD